MSFIHYAAPLTAETSQEIVSTCLLKFDVMPDKLTHPAIPPALYSVRGPMFVVASFNEHDDPNTVKPFHVQLITLEEFLRDRDWLDRNDTIGPFRRMQKAR